MRLRTLLFLAFALVALTPLAVAVPLASRRMEETFGRELSARADAAALLATSELERLGADVVSALEGCAVDPATESLAQQVVQGAAPPADAMRAVAEGRPLEVLALRDAAGVT